MEIQNIKTLKSCPRFMRCNVPICPLDECMKMRVYVEGDPRCTLSKSRRKHLGHGLPWRGLFPKELSGLNIWSKQSSESKAKVLRNLVPKRSKSSFTLSPQNDGGKDGR
ncbi:MAG: hypothetical protein ACD_22C00047G0006 [uncultured bacterium]|nr:MAG: hypothetical protein ACD_22C00047G0006 [uncultured bacterium]